MDVPDLVDHLLNFIAPALFVALMLALLSCAAPGQSVAAGGWLRRGWRSFWVNAAVGVTALAGGLIVFGQDGKMLSYAALVLACTSSQWLLSRSGRG